VKPLRCGFGMPLDQLDPETRKVIEDFQRYLRGDLALAADGLTYVPVDSPDAVHVVDRPGVTE
jgi:hypothetical protein